ncbi:amylo-alpha-1,6-glucosidase [Mesotoga sp.]|uniref:amylo-alpha-1,6-glucosidase n=1 Tax=Mesotoga sp. TaxID=2053577 RepID=UPI00345E4FBC
MTADHIICVLEREGKKLSDTIEKIGYRTGNDLHCKKNRLLIVDDFIPERRDVLAAIRELPTILIGKAVKIVELIGLDEPGKIDRRSTILDDSPWDKRGFQCYKNHPLFEGLHGGFYSIYLNGFEKMPEVFYYLGRKAKVIAVEKRYISYLRSNKLIWFHESENHSVLSIGGYLPVGKIDNPYKAELEKFLENAISWMLSENKTGNYWKDSKSIFIEDYNMEDILLPTISPVEEWPSPSMEITNATGYINSTGRRILANASCRRVDEVWVHPFRVLRYVEISIDGKALSSLLKKISYSPEKIVYTFDNGEVFVFCSLDKPNLFFQFHFSDGEIHDIEIGFESDLRIMWPMDDSFNGRKTFCKLENGFRLKTEDEQIRTLMVFSSPVSATVEKIDERIRVSFTSRITDLATFSVLSSIESEEFPTVINMQEEIREAREFYSKYLERSPITTDNARLNEALNLAKISTVKFRVSTPTIGTGIMAGYASSRPGWFSARPGYAWYFGRDSLWCSLALLDIGDYDTVKENLELLINYQRIDGKIYHELTTSNVVHYDAADSTPLFLYTMYRYCVQSGDIGFAGKNWDKIEKALNYCSKTDSDGDGLIENTIAGHGWIEGGKLYGAKASFYLNCIWIAALRGIGILSGYLGKEKVKFHLLDLQKRCLIGLEKLFDPEIGFVLGIDEWGKQMKFRTIMSSMGAIFDIISPERIIDQVKEFASDDFSSDWGTRIIGKNSGIYNPTGYHEGSVWPLFTGWASLAQFKHGADLDAFNHTLANLYTCKDFSSGFIPEVINGEVYELSGVCAHQAWSETMGLQPFYEGVLGIEPDMINGILSLNPSIPLSIRSIEAPSLPLGKSNFEFHYNCTVEYGDFIEVTQYFKIRTNKQVPVHFASWVPVYSSGIEISSNGNALAIRTENGITSKRVEVIGSLSGFSLDIRVKYRSPFLLLPIEPSMYKGKESSQPRIMGIEEQSRGSWKLHVRVRGKQCQIPFIASRQIKVENAILEEGSLRIRGHETERYKSVFVLLKEKTSDS